LELEKPVDFVRVALAAEDKLLHTVNGWPASFVREMGRGKVLFTTIGARAWFRPRTSEDPRSPFSAYPDLPVPLRALSELPRKLPPGEAKTLDVEALEPLVSSEIGYTVPSRGTAGVIFGAFLLVVVGLGLGLRQSRWPELVGWLAPVAAVVAAAVFLALGEASRRAVPPTLTVAEIVHVAPGTRDQAAVGMLALYRPDAGPVPAASTAGGMVELDTAGIQGQTRRRVVTDTDSWHWENLALPAGLRLGRFRATVQRGEPLAAVVQFGPAGLTGRVTGGSYRELADAIISTPTRHPIAVRFGSDGTFVARNDDLLPTGQYLPGAVLSDRQQQRAEVYHRILGKTEIPQLEGRSVLLTWAEPPGVPFTLEPEARTVTSSLLAIPLEFEHPPAGTHLTVPRAFIPYSRILFGTTAEPTLEARSGVNMRLRFQLPPSVLPLQVERARLFARLHAPGRRFSVGGYTGATPVEQFATEGPAGSLQAEITQETLLRLDDEGGLFLNVVVGDLPEEVEGQATPGIETRWAFDFLELEVTGRTLPEK
jgi:hypothetical protein